MRVNSPVYVHIGLCEYVYRWGLALLLLFVFFNIAIEYIYMCLLLCNIYMSVCVYQYFPLLKVPYYI